MPAAVTAARCDLLVCMLVLRRHADKLCCPCLSLFKSTDATVLFPVQEAALENNFSLRPKRLLMAGLAVTSSAYVFTLLPLLFTDKSGSLLFWAGLPWGTMAVASALIAVKPKENEGWYTPW